jgi:hypothetical protein
MGEIRHFDRLASELSVEERGKLLEKLSGQSSLASSVLYEDMPDEGAIVPQATYEKLPWYYKAWFYFLSFFNSRPPLKLYEDHLMNKLYRDLEEKTPGFYNYQKDMILPKFKDELEKLRDASRFFYSALDTGINRDKGGLLIFLGSLEMPEIHTRIVSDTDPGTLTVRFRDLAETEIRQQALKTLEDALAGITEDERGRMYQSARSLFCLKQLSSFLFDRLINSFIYDSSSQGYICPAASARDPLAALNNILFSLKTPPPVSLLESLFVFALRERSDEPNLDIHNEMRKLLVQAEISLEAIREFNTEVPLTKLLRCISRNPGLAPKNIGGGEDWYQVFRERWKNQIEDDFFSFTRTRRQRELQNSFRYFLKGTSLKMLENMGSDQNPSGINVRGNFNLSFLQTFYSVVFMGDANKFLRPILIEGEFVKKENRAEFTECYNNLIKMDDLILRFDKAISLEGDIGKRYMQAKNEMSSLPVKRRKIQIILEEAAAAADRIIVQTREALDGMVKILGGILKKSADGKYDTLANLQTIAGRGTAFQEGIAESIIQLKKAHQLIDDIDAMEAGR